MIWLKNGLNRKLVVWGLVSLIICIASYFTIDLPVARYFKALKDDPVVGVFRVLTHLGDAIVYLLGSALVWAGLRLGVKLASDVETREKYRRWSYGPALMLLTGLSTGILVNILKYAIGRYRPRHLFNEGIYGFEPFNTVWSMNSFPSGHSQAAFAGMTAMCVMFPRFWSVWIGIAFTIALSRVVLSVHYFSDTVMGSYIAIAGCLLLARWMRAKGWEPRLSSR